MNEEQMRAEFEAWYRDKFCKTLSGMATDEMMYIGSNGEYSSFHVRGAWEGWQAALSAKSVPTLSDNEFSALVRCEQTMIDDNSYDIDATMMRKLADCGAVWHKGGGFYQITKFGNYLLKTKNGSITAAPQSPTDDDRVRELEKDAERLDFITAPESAWVVQWEKRYGKPVRYRMIDDGEVFGKWHDTARQAIDQAMNEANK